MNLADLRAEFLRDLNRKDCTSTDADAFIAQALRRIQRELRLPAVERGMVFQATTEALASVLIPNDLIALIDVFVPVAASDGGAVASDGEFPLTAMSYRTLQQFPLSGPVSGYARLTNRFYFRGAIPVGSYVKVVYYGTEPSLEGDDTETPIMASAASPMPIATGLGLARPCKQGLRSRGRLAARAMAVSFHSPTMTIFLVGPPSVSRICRSSPARLVACSPPARAFPSPAASQWRTPTPIIG